MLCLSLKKYQFYLLGEEKLEKDLHVHEVIFQKCRRKVNRDELGKVSGGYKLLNSTSISPDRCHFIDGCDSSELLALAFISLKYSGSPFAVNVQE